MAYKKMDDPIKKNDARSPIATLAWPNPDLIKIKLTAATIAILAIYIGIRNLCLFTAFIKALDVGEKETKNLAIIIIEKSSMEGPYLGKKCLMKNVTNT